MHIPRTLLALCAAAAAAAILTPAGCSKQTLMRSGYETMHNVSDQRNDIDPRYDPQRPSYEDYQREREEVLRGHRQGGAEGDAPEVR